MLSPSTPLRTSLTQKHWIEPTQNHSATDLVVRLMKERGIDPRPRELPSPTLFPDLDRAVDRIRSAIDRTETVGLFGDYDCDGITATAQLVRFFRRNGVEPVVRLPHRERDGYGLNPSIIDEFVTQNVDLLITADTGIVSVDEVALAKQKGIDVIITDHHQPQEELPDALAILHPALSPSYPVPHPSGAGVVFQLLRACETKACLPAEREVDCALAAIGTVADLVELRGANRTLVQQGIACLRQLTSGPLKDLIEASRIDQKALSATDIGFRIGPRINAAGRIAEPMLALWALLDGGPAIAELSTINDERQDRTRSLTEEAIGLFDPERLPPFLFVTGEQYHCGIVGLIAGRLTEQFGRPSLVASVTGETCTASLRSIPDYSVVSALQRCDDLLTHFGGHTQAAGCSFPLSHAEELGSRLVADISERIAPDQLVPSISVDAIIDPKDITQLLCSQLSQLEPYGQGNREPIFLLTNMNATDVCTVGADNDHLRCRVSGLKAIGFRLGSLIDQMDQPLDLLCRIGLDTWNGRTEPQLFIEDIRTRNGSAYAEPNLGAIKSAI